MHGIETHGKHLSENLIKISEIFKCFDPNSKLAEILITVSSMLVFLKVFDNRFIPETSLCVGIP
jgi:hypothetical protein